MNSALHTRNKLNAAALLFALFACLFTGSAQCADAQTGASDPLPLRGLSDDKYSPDTQNPPPGAINQYSNSEAQRKNNSLSTPLDEIRFRSIESSGTIFVDPEKISIKAPLLSALISLNSKMSPYELDAASGKGITLKDTLLTALQNNLDIRISRDQTKIKRWQYLGNLTNFLPGIDNTISFQGLQGSIANPAGVALPLTNPFLTMGTELRQPLFTGGNLFYSAMQAKHEYKASDFALKGSTNDILYQATKLYYGLLEDEVLLQIRIKALEVSDGLVVLNEDLFEGGVVTKVDLLQARTQRSKDRQNLINQQIDRRKAAVNLSSALNVDTAIDLSAANKFVAKTRLIDENTEIAELLRIAVDSRPELKQYDQLRKAAKDAIKVARAALLPHVNMTGAILGTGSRVSPLNGSSSVFTSVLSGGGSVAGPVSSGSIPLSNTGEGARTFVNKALFILGVEVSLPLRGIGLTDAANIQTARMQARRVESEFSRVLVRIYQEVRNAYLEVMDAENLIRETTDQVIFAEEQLAVAEYRLRNGVGTNLDVINAQRDYTGSLVDKAKAIIKFNTAEAQLLHATGRISVDTLTAEVPIRK